MFDASFWEGVKESGRWVLLLLVSWLITETLNQAVTIPETYTVSLWSLSYIVPLRTVVVFTLTVLGRFIDKWLHEIGKTTENLNLMKGLTRF